MPLSEDRARHVRRLRRLPRDLAERVRDWDDSRLDTPYREGGWTVRQVVHHLADAHLNGWLRVRLALTEDRPTLKPYDQNAWAALPDAATAPVGLSLGLLAELHERLALLFEGLEDDAWQRAADHPESGLWTVAGMLEIYADHGEHHLRQIQALADHRGW